MNKTEYQFSIIVPVYNASEFLENCLKSILSQTFKDFEVICINDGSTDNSLEILEKYAKKDNRIKIFSQNNLGVSAARNLGIDVAKGEYILFCDADDKYKTNLCSVVSSTIHRDNSDIIAFGHENYIDGFLDDVDFKYISKIKKKNKLKDWLSLQVFIWEKAFKREFLLKNNIRFPVGIKNAEDLIFCLLGYFSGGKYSLVEEALYEYQKELKGNSTFTNPYGIENDTKAYNHLIQMNIFKRLSFKEQLAFTDFFIGGSVVYYKKLKNTEHHQKILKDLNSLYSIIINQYSFWHCLKMRNFRRIYKAIFKEKHKDIFANFNIITTPVDKTYIFAGIKIKINRKKSKKQGGLKCL